MTKLIREFDIWRPGYGGAEVTIYIAGTTDLADVFTDENLSVAADNPQTLSSMLGDDGTRYGKFAAPLYTGQSYYLDIDATETTGVVRPPISSLDGEDASLAEVTASGSDYALPLEDMAALSVNVAQYGAWVAGGGGVAATNNATLELAIAALSSGGEVIIPAGTYKITSTELPQGVVLRGAGREATILQSVLGDVTFTVVGDRAGLRDLTLDGSSLTAGSIGIYSENIDEIIFDHVLIKRFETGMQLKGGKGHIWTDFSIDNVATGAKLHGDGATFSDLIWNGGLVSVATTKGIDLSYEDDLCLNITVAGVGFEDCAAGTAVNINGAQNIKMIGCWWSGNTVNINIQDDTATLAAANIDDNVVIGVNVRGGRMSSGEVEVTGTIENVVLENMKIEGVTFTMTTSLDNFLVLRDCYEDSAVTLAGETTKLIRETTTNNGASYGLTTNNSATKAWSIALEPGQMAYLEGKVIGLGRNVGQRGIYHISVGAYRPGSTLAYDTQTANFTAGKVLTGATSGATARIQSDSDSGTTGTLTLIDIQGEFLDNEIITDDNGTPGSATVNGTLTAQNVSADTVGVTSLRTAYETNANWAATFVANGPEMELRVTGDTSQTVEWTVHVDVTTN